MSEKFSFAQMEELSHLETVLDSIKNFIDRHETLTYIEFDYYTTQEMTLFYVEPDFDFLKFKDKLEEFNRVLPSIKRIFSKPIIILNDKNDILPVEIVSKINSKTLAYLGTHSNDVGNIKNKRITPKRLLTSIYEDDYALYENIIFCNFVDEMLLYLRNNNKILRSLLYASEMMQFNLLERTNHIDYFLALGKLHTGYIRDFDKYYDVAKTLVKNISSLNSIIKAYFKKPVYKLNKKRKYLPLKKTNIFLMQKDYKNIYLSYKNLLKEKEKIEAKKEINYEKIEGNYFYYLEILSIFSIGHFGFKNKFKKAFSLKDLNLDFTFKKWSVKIKRIDKYAILFDIKKDTNYRIVLIPNLTYKEKEYNIKLMEFYKADEIVYADPFEEDYMIKKSVLISMENIESFRRIQQMLLKGMVYSDTKRDECPFCSSKLLYNKNEERYECPSCNLVIKKTICPTTGKAYFYTSLNLINRVNLLNNDSNLNSKWIYNRRLEGSLFFKNITRINQYGEIICPICGKIH